MTDVFAPFTLPLRREGDAAIVDATGETVLVIDPDRRLEDDQATAIADHVFALTDRTDQTPWVVRVMEAREEGDGFWRACSGCQENVDGHVSTRDYPYSAAFGCQPGGGCSECGGLGVKWDTTDYDAMATSMLADTAAEDAGEVDLYDDNVQAGIAWTMRQWGETLGLKTWTQGDGSESVEGDVGTEIHTILVDAGLRDPETNEMASLRAPPREPEGGVPLFDRDALIALIMDETNDDIVADGWDRLGKPNVLVQGCRYIRRNALPSPEGYANPEASAKQFAGFIADRILKTLAAKPSRRAGA